MKVLHLHRAEIHQALLLKFSKADSDCKPWLILTKVPITKPARLSYYLTQNLTILKGRELTENHFSSDYKLFFTKELMKILACSYTDNINFFNKTAKYHQLTLDVDMAHRNFPSHFHLHGRSKYYIVTF